MGVNPIAGTGVFLLGGVAAALYLLPFRAVKGWSYERGWLLSVIAGWLVFPLVFDWFVVPDVFAVLRSDGCATLARTVGFGALWGVGALAWALMVRYLGVGLGLAIGAGLCAAAGTLLPPIVTGNAVSLVPHAGRVWCWAAFSSRWSALRWWVPPASSRKGRWTKPPRRRPWRNMTSEKAW